MVAQFGPKSALRLIVLGITLCMPVLAVSAAEKPCPPDSFSVNGTRADSDCGTIGLRNHAIHQKSADGLRAFPTAEGFGAQTVGGRGGRVIYVENLNNDGAGSLRAALMAKGPRTVLFRVSGTIEISNRLFVTEPFLTIDARTAPGDGILIKTKSGTMDQAPISIGTSEVIVRYLRIRPGPNNFADACCGDALSIGHAFRQVRNVIIDHSSFGWAEDEHIDTYYDTSNVTIQWSILSEALNQVASGGDSLKNVERTGKGALFNSTADNFRISVHHNLFAFNPTRNARFGAKGDNPNGLAEYVNNYVYGWKSAGVEIGRYAYGFYNILPLNATHNYFEAMVSTSDQRCPSHIDEGLRVRPVIHLSENINHTARNSSDKTLLDPAKHDPWKLMCFGGGSSFATVTADRSYQSVRPHAGSPTAITIDPVLSIREIVLEGAGATLPVRDAIDERVIRQVRTKQGKIINDPANVGGYPNLRAGASETDSDSDGMPDTFEISVGLNPNFAEDGIQDADGDGYTNLEEYLNNL